MIAEAALCIALNVFYDPAPKEPMEGKLAVAFVPRTRAQRNGTSVCWEIFKESQFSWANDGLNLRVLPSGPKWDEALLIAQEVVDGKVQDFTRGATHYHAIGSRPRWAKDPKLVRVGVWGSHVFYRSVQ